MLEVTPITASIDVNGIRSTAARWPVQLKASSSAQLKWLDESVEPGNLVKKGDVLARLDIKAPRSGCANLAQALSSLKQAELELKQAKHEQMVGAKMPCLTQKRVRLCSQRASLLAAKAT
ncbi:hypothetical protein O9929_23635 [Vibrio lentus]|nr:hypothetical protein [Vibrio lentus]